MAPYYAELVARYQVPVEQVARNEELRRQVMEEVLTNKVVYFLLSSSKINYVAEEEHDHEHDHEGHDHEHHEHEPAHAGKKEAKADDAETKDKEKAEAKPKS